ncbi:MAG: alkaline phosphatase family protein, partial [Pseudobdellovibrionaceae bacterium]
PHFISLYFSDVDSMGHKHGPDAEETKKSVLDIDQELGRLKAFIAKSGLPVQVVAVSDHGMKSIDETVDLSSAKSLMQMKDSGRGAIVYFYSDDTALIESAYKEVKQLQTQSPGKFRIYKAKDLPKRWQMDDVDRRGDLIVVGEPGVYVGFKRTENGSVSSSNKATHGWDVQQTPEMLGLFIANGSAFKRGLTIPAFDNVHVYPMVMGILGLKTTVANDSNSAVLKPILKNY